MVRYAQCCQPVPGDSVVGYVTQGRGISIHRSDCPNLLTLAAEERRVDIDWQETAGEAFAVRLAVTGEDRRGLYADIMEAVSQTGHQHPRRRPPHPRRLRVRHHLRRGGQPAAPRQGDEGGAEGERRDRDRAAGGPHRPDPPCDFGHRRPVPPAPYSSRSSFFKLNPDPTHELSPGFAQRAPGRPIAHPDQRRAGRRSGCYQQGAGRGGASPARRLGAERGPTRRRPTTARCSHPRPRRQRARQPAPGSNSRRRRDSRTHSRRPARRGRARDEPARRDSTSPRWARC